MNNNHKAIPVYKDNSSTYSITDFSLNNLQERDYIVFDLEATGLNTDTEKVTQIGLVEYNIREGITGRHNFFINPVKQIPDNIEKLTGLSNDMLEDKPLFKDVWKDIYEKYKDRTWIAQCGFEFDFRIINTECGNSDLKEPAFDVLDTKVLFACLYSNMEDTFSTDFMTSFYNISTADLRRHSALDDAILVSRILDCLLQDYCLKGINSINIRKEMMIKKFIPQ